MGTSKTTDRVIDKVRAFTAVNNAPSSAKLTYLIESRAQAGKDKYGVTMDREDLSIEEWRMHALEEVLDSLNYFEKIITLSDSAVERLRAEAVQTYLIETAFWLVQNLKVFK